MEEFEKSPLQAVKSPWKSSSGLLGNKERIPHAVTELINS